jgi:hypothetical protein
VLLSIYSGSGARGETQVRYRRPTVGREIGLHPGWSLRVEEKLADLGGRQSSREPPRYA